MCCTDCTKPLNSEVFSLCQSRTATKIQSGVARLKLAATSSLEESADPCHAVLLHQLSFGRDGCVLTYHTRKLTSRHLTPQREELGCVRIDEMNVDCAKLTMRRLGTNLTLKAPTCRICHDRELFRAISARMTSLTALPCAPFCQPYLYVIYCMSIAATTIAWLNSLYIFSMTAPLS